MNKAYAKCALIEDSRLKTLEEKGKKLVIANSKLRCYELIRSDGCFLDSVQKKCDWIIAISINKQCFVFFVELKGVDLGQACLQLKSTMDATKKFFSGFTVKCLVVCRRVPRGGTEHQVFKKKFFNATKSTLDIHCQQFRLEI
jgi:hypothetical protein